MFIASCLWALLHIFLTPGLKLNKKALPGTLQVTVNRECDELHWLLKLLFRVIYIAFAYFPLKASLRPQIASRRMRTNNTTIYLRGRKIKFLVSSANDTLRLLLS